MDSNWQTKKLGEVSEIQTGKWDANHAIENGKYRFIPVPMNICFVIQKGFQVRV